MKILKSRLTITVHAGFDEDGQEVFKTKNFSNVNNLATEEQLLLAAQALVTLQQHTLESVTRTNMYNVF